MDVIVFRSSLVGQCDTDWGGGVISTELNIEKAKDYMEESMKNIVSSVLKHKEWQSEYKVIPCLSDKVNFRKTLYPQYKANRTKPKPLLYQDLRRYAEEIYNCQCYPNIEGDDCIGILATTLDNVVICSIDKDFHTIPNVTFHNFYGGKDTFSESTEESAAYAHYYQCLLGDSVDNYPGCKGVGKVGAKKALDADCSWEAVVKLYESKGFTEEYALVQARVAKILTADLWNSEKQQVILWQPKSVQECSNECQKEEEQ